MKLWKAMLIGCDRRAQAFGSLFRNNQHDGTCTSCALGAAWEGRFGHLIYKNDLMYDEFPILRLYVAAPAEVYEALPSGRAREKFPVDSIITYLNDNRKWSRERIALEFVKPLEEQDDI